MPNVAIIGAGLIGRAWSAIFARAGWDVAAWDPVASQQAAAPGLIAAQLAEMAKHGLADHPEAAAKRIRMASSLEDAVASADFVQENGPELPEAKTALFAALDKAARPGVVLASSTSAIVASQFTEKLAGRDRCLVGHPVNPPHLVPVVEICGSPWTSDAAKARAREVYASIGQVPITVKKEIDGFILNRLQAALLTEAFRLVQEGYVSPQDLDHTVADGLGLRWSFMGPFATIELNAPEGIADYCRRYGPFFKRTLDKQPTKAVWDDANVAKVTDAWGGTPTKDHVSRKSAWRDARLAQLAAHKRKAIKSDGGTSKK
jgi:L-gulonate 3-dehydrogenase